MPADVNLTLKEYDFFEACQTNAALRKRLLKKPVLFSVIIVGKLYTSP